MMDISQANEIQFLDDRCNLLFPWYVKPFLDVLKTWDLSDKRVFEYGGGYSTIWWNKYAKEVVTLDSSMQWIEEISEYLNRLELPGQLHNHTIKEKYVDFLLSQGGFDIIIIDGEHRDECVIPALTQIKTGGIIIVDNWNQDHVEGIGSNTHLLEHYEHHIYVQHDHKAHNGRPWKTAYFIIK